ILDLEDSVHREEKDAARILVRNALRTVDFGPCERMVRINQLPLGLEDLAEVETTEGRESQYARSRVVNAARAAGVQDIDSVFSDVADMDGLRRWAEGSRAAGFEGMGCIHPGQIRVVHEAFQPTAVEIEKAGKVVAAFEEAQSKGLAVVSLGSKMIDPTVVQRALKLVERAKAMGAIS